MIDRNRSISSWMAAVVLGTYAGAWGFATASALLRGGMVKWVVLMAVCSGLAALQTILLGAIDLVLLWLKVRMLPQGRTAWLGAIGSSAVTLAVGMGWPFSRWMSPVGFLFSVLPLLAIPLATRLLSGVRPDGLAR